MKHQNDKLVEIGNWKISDDESVDWELYTSSNLPNVADTTAVFCLAIMSNEKILLVKEKRGWNTLGGHIEEGESVEEALKRECLEEGGFVPAEPVLFAYRKIIAHKPLTHPQSGRAYPFPISYIAYCWSTTNNPLVPPSEPDVLDVQAFDMDEVSELDPTDLSVIKIGWDLYKKSGQS